MSEHSPTPWEVVEANENHGAYVVNVFGGEVCDLYAMSNPSSWSVANGGDSRAVPFLDADANAAFIVKASNHFDDLVKKLEEIHDITQDTTLHVECWQKLQNIAATAASALASIKERQALSRCNSSQWAST